MFPRYRPVVRRPQSKFKKCTSKIWHLCTFKISCSVWMLLVFSLTVLYLRDNYANVKLPSISFIEAASIWSPSSSSSSTSSVSYLNPLSLHSLGYGTCPYTNPSFPSIGPDQSYLCPLNKKYRAGILWYLQTDMISNDDMDEFFKQSETLKFIMKNNTNTTNKLSLKKNDKLHLTYQYMSCQTQKEIKTAKAEWQNIINNEKYVNIFKKYGYTSWQDAKICFDEIICMNDKYDGAVNFNLYLNDAHQNMMKELIDKTEEIQENEYEIDLSFKRNIHQQSFHISIASILNSNDYDAFDAKSLMDKLNKAMNGKFPCISLGKEPTFKNEWCYNSQTLKEGSTTFQWKCAPIE